MRCPLTEFFQIPVSSAVSPSTPNHNAAARREEFLERYSRNMDSLLNTGEGLIALHELLSGDITRELSLSDSGRAGLAYIIKTLAEENMNACGSLPAPYQMKKMLEEAAHEQR